jgi:hypothetical protein
VKVYGRSRTRTPSWNDIMLFFVRPISLALRPSQRWLDVMYSLVTNLPRKKTLRSESTPFEEISKMRGTVRGLNWRHWFAHCDGPSGSTSNPEPRTAQSQCFAPRLSSWNAAIESEANFFSQLSRILEVSYGQCEFNSCLPLGSHTVTDTNSSFRN